MPAFEDLTERERQILANLINYYIASADPVGSRVIANKFKMGLSSATIRNTLQDLEELGLVEQPHTSAGRVPTDIGYRVYVDYLLKPEKLSPNEEKLIRATIQKEGRSINELLGQTAKLLGDISNQLGVTVAPRFESGTLKSIRLIPVADGRIMVIVVVGSGLARSVILEVEASVSERSLAEVESILNERLAGLSLKAVRETISRRMADVSGNARLINLIVDSKERIWTDERTEAIHVAGADRLVSMPEFFDRERLSRLMKLLEDSRMLSEFFEQAQNEGLFITIGKENRLSEIINCSVVSSSYRVGNITGTIGIIGPTRMPYSKLVSIVEYTARSITEVLSGMDDAKGK
ncbi:MAG TPA: heat-inducible transcriptional repressor HrcA [Candidatus Acidoferrum sp.]|nr:heat-inducible transcriptional repressor HrcA [Candidatus Acidoferrum sp.]